MENKKLKILAIDDNQDNLTSVKALIREAFPQALVLTATEAGQGIELAQTEDPDAILLDVVMPGMDGFEACQQLKANPLTRYIPVVFLTAIKGDKEARIRALEVGAEAFLSKPIDEIELTAQIRAMQKIKAASEHERAEKENLTELVAARTRELDLAHTAALNLLEDLRKENIARQESEAHLRLLFENLPSGVVVHAPDTAVLLANPEALRLLGLTLEQIQGKTAIDPAWNFLSEDGVSLPLDDYPVNRVRFSGKTLAGQIIGICLPGQAEPNWVQCSSYPQLDASGMISQVIVAFADITAQKQVEQNLREREVFQNLLMSTIPTPVFYKDRQGRYLGFNKAFEEFYGKTKELLVGKSVFDIAPPELARIYHAKDLELLECPGTQVYEAQMQDAQGNRRDVVFHKASIVEAQGGVAGLIGIILDVTVRKRAEAKIEQESLLSNTIIDSIPGTFYLLDEHGHYVRWNTYQREVIIGKPEDQILGMNALDTIHPEDRATIQTRIANVLRDGKEETVVGRVLLHGGPAFIWMLMTGRRMMIEGRPFLVGTGIDVTERKQAEEALRKSQAILQAAMDRSTAGIAIADAPGGELRYVNDAGLLIRGETREAVVNGIGINEYVASWHILDLDGRPLEMDEVPLTRAVRFGETCSREFIIRRTEGDDRIVSANAAPIRDEAGKVVAGIVVFLDITERKLVEAALLRSEALQGKMISNIGDVIVIIDANGINRYKSKNIEKFFGWKPEEVVGQSALANVHPDDLNAAQAFIANLLKTPDATGDIEVRYRCKDGRYKWISFTGCNLMHDPDINGILGNYHDITERKRAEAERLRLSMAMEQANDAVVVTDHEGAIQYVNPAFEKVTGYSRLEALGMNPSFLKSGKQDAAFYRRMWAMLAAGETWSGHMINKRKDGSLYEEDASISPIRDGLGKIVNYVAVKRDVTREVQLEEQLQQAQKMESVGRLAGGVAHDFNNLLMGIMGYTELCREKVEAGHPIQEYLTEIVSGAQRSAEITRQLLAFARKQTIAPIALDLNDAVAGMLKLLRRLIGEDIKLTWKPGADLRMVKLDPSQVDQILANLCVNARDAIGGVGEVVLETGSTTIDAEYCAIHPEAIPGTYAILAVSDNGCGMDKATLAQIFEPFFTTKGVGKGTGLGLATVYGIVKQNNGFINVYSEPGKGTTFRIHLPVITDENVATTVTSKPAAPRGQGETILLVEDDASVRTTCGLFLLASNYKVLTAESPEQALVIAGRTPGDIQLLLTDVVMPGMDGRQLAKRIREDRPDIKVLFMSGYTADLIAKRGVLDEGVQFISKPFSRDALTRKLRQVLENTSEQAFMQDPSDSTVPGASI